MQNSVFILSAQFLAVVLINAQDLDPTDTYTFCGQVLSRDNSACLGFCEQSQTICSRETGVCSCKLPATKLRTLPYNYNCKPAKPRSRCSNACKSYAMINPTFRRGETKICQSKTENKRMCFCLPKNINNVSSSSKPKNK